MLNFDPDNLEAFMKKLAVLGFWFAVVCLGWTGDMGIAQTITGSVRGLVTNPSGAVVVGAQHRHCKCGYRRDHSHHQRPRRTLPTFSF